MWRCTETGTRTLDAGAPACDDTVRFCFASAKNKLNVGKLMARLEEILPLKEHYPHLKRVRSRRENATITSAADTAVGGANNSITDRKAHASETVVDLLLMPWNSWESLLPASRAIIDAEILPQLEGLQPIDVPAGASCDAGEFELQDQKWPLFRPKQLLHKQPSTELPGEDVSYADAMLRLIHEEAAKAGSSACAIALRCGSCTVVRGLASSTTSEVSAFPLDSCVFKAIQQVADSDLERSRRARAAALVEPETSVAGQKRSHAVAFSTLATDKSGATTDRIVMSVGVPHDAVPPGSYICTAHDAFLTHEPDLMNAMALLHSRVNRIFFNRRAADGALVSAVAIQALPAVNHRYKVYECTLDSTSGAAGTAAEAMSPQG